MEEPLHLQILRMVHAAEAEGRDVEGVQVPFTQKFELMCSTPPHWFQQSEQGLSLHGHLITFARIDCITINASSPPPPLPVPGFRP